MAQNHIYYMAYIETHFPMLDIKDIRTSEFQFLGKDQWDSGMNIYAGKITIKKDAFIWPTCCNSLQFPPQLPLILPW